MAKALKTGLMTLGLAALLSGCAQVGSESWCNDMKEKPKGDWSSNDAADFAKHCVF
ncbi:MAG: DUF3012 domain-containing protein [Halopseudomonas sp.]